VSEKNTLLIGIFLAVCVLTIHLWKPAVVTPSQAVAIQPVHSKPQAHFQSEPVANPAPLPAPEMEAAKTDDPDNLNVKSETRRELMARLRDWAAKDLDGALTYVSKMPDGDERNGALEAVCFGLAQKDPAQAVELAQTLQQPEAVMENLVQQWAATDLPSALIWVNNQPASDQRDQLIARTTFILSKTDPSDAASLVMEQISPGPAQDEAIMTVVNQWGNKNPAAAAAWVGHFPEGPLQERAVQELEGIVDYKQALAHP